jgi:hypothetical protein
LQNQIIFSIFAKDENVLCFNDIKRAKNGIGTVLFGAISGGVGSHLTGGNFWQGAVTGGIVAGLNHELHDMGDPPYKPSFTEKLIYNIMPKLVKFRYFVISQFTGQSRHMYGPDAISVIKNVAGGAIVGGTAGAGGIYVTRGIDKGFYSFGDVGFGVSSISISTGFSLGEYFYGGSLSNMSSQTFSGNRFEVGFSIDVGFSLGFSASWSTNIDDYGFRTFGTANFLGWGKSLTLLDIGINKGDSYVGKK